MRSTKLPKGWSLSGSRPADYDVEVEPGGYGGKPAVSLRCTESEGFGTICQVFKAEAYRGKRLRLSAALRSRAVDRWAGLWMRVDDLDGRTIAFDNMQNRPVVGTTEWARHAVVLDVAERGSLKVAFGVLLNGQGEVQLADVRIEEVGDDVPTTAMPTVHEHPVNLDFSE